MKQSKIIELLDKYELSPATKRELPLLTLSVIVFAYTKLLKEKVGSFYEAFGAVGEKNSFYTLLNVYHVAKKTKELIEESDNLDEVFDKAITFFNYFKNELNKIKIMIKENPVNFLRFISKNYPNYMLSIGIYNCFWRYIGDEKNKMNSKQLERISKERQLVAELYLEVEKLIKSCVDLIGNERNFEGDLLRYLTLEELKSFLIEQKISKIKLNKLKRRRDGYFYLFFENKEQIFTDKNIIEEVNNKFFKIKFKNNVLKGVASYHGLVKGFVKVVFKENDLSKIEKNDVLVMSMTFTNSVKVLTKVAAIITDEGGILSHAAIISREIKKPCIIGTKIATQVLKDGDFVEVDANKGIIKIIKRK